MAIVEVLAVGPLGCNMVIIADPETMEAVLVDPGGDPERIISLINSKGYIVKQILITHAHLDHILATAEVKEHTSAPVFYHEGDRQLWLSLPLQCMFLGLPSPNKTLKPPENILQDGQELLVRGGRCLYTPGHTQGSCCFYFPNDSVLVSGDTLFCGSIGRTDLPGGSYEQIMESLRSKILNLPDDTRVITGHGEETTIGSEKAQNPFLK